MESDMQSCRSPLPIVLAMVVCMSAGCATVPYEYGKAVDRPPVLELREGEQQVETGRPCLPLDVTANILSLPVKLILFNVRVDSHWIRTNTVAALQDYLRDNELNQVKVRVNQYSPTGEWGRLFRNKSVGLAWRCTLGALSVGYYTIMPGRLFGGDNYNPYTQTISLYSDHAGIALHEGAHAKDAAGRKYKGCYAVTRMLPLIAPAQETIATRDALGYQRDKQLFEDEQSSLRVLYPAFSTYIVPEILLFDNKTAPAILQLGTLIPAHILGRIKAKSLARRHDSAGDRSPSSSANAQASHVPTPVTDPDRAIQ